MNIPKDYYEIPDKKEIDKVLENIKSHYINELGLDEQLIEKIFSNTNIEKIKTQIFENVGGEIASQFESEIFSQIHTNVLEFELDASENTENICDVLCEIYSIILDNFGEANGYSEGFGLNCGYIIENKNPLKIFIFPLKPDLENLEKTGNLIGQIFEHILTNYELSQQEYKNLSDSNGDILELAEKICIENFELENFLKNLEIFYQKLIKHKFFGQPDILKLGIILADLEKLKPQNIDYDFINTIFSQDSKLDFVEKQLQKFDFGPLEELKVYDLILPFLERHFKEKFVEQKFSNPIFLTQNIQETNMLINYLGLEMYLGSEFDEKDQEKFGKLFLSFQKSPTTTNRKKLISFLKENQLHYTLSNKLFETFMKDPEVSHFSYPQVDEIFENSSLEIGEKTTFSGSNGFEFRKSKKTLSDKTTKSQLAKALEEFDASDSGNSEKKSSFSA